VHRVAANMRLSLRPNGSDATTPKLFLSQVFNTLAVSVLILVIGPYFHFKNHSGKIRKRLQNKIKF